MTVILHASDLHFGKADPATVEKFYHEIERQRPDLVILSGDFTQVGSKEEFEAAETFINRITAPVFTVPGNHDVPRFQTWQRLTDPFARYRRYIAPLPDTAQEYNFAHVVGINTARAVLPHWNWANGMISRGQIDFVRQQFRTAPAEKVRIFVCHHPLANFKNSPIDTVVWNSAAMVKVLDDEKVDIVLTGHIHHALILPSEDAKGPVMVGAGSATSTRLRSQTNGYNILRLTPDKIEIELIHWDGAAHTVFENLSVNRRLVQ